MTGSNHSLIHQRISKTQINNEAKLTSTSTNTEEENQNVVAAETTEKVVQTTNISGVESCKGLHNIGVLSKDNKKSSDAEIKMGHEEKIPIHHHVIKLTKMNWLNQMGTNSPRASRSPRSLSSTDVYSDNSEADFSDEPDVGLKCLSTVLNLDKEHNMFGLSSYGDVILQRSRAQPKPRSGKPVFHQTTIIHACCTVKCTPPQGCKAKCITPGCCKHVSKSDLPSSLKMVGGSCGMCGSPPPCPQPLPCCPRPPKCPKMPCCPRSPPCCPRSPPCTKSPPCPRSPICHRISPTCPQSPFCARPCVFTCAPGQCGQLCSRMCSRPCSQPCLSPCPPKPCPPKPCARPCPPKPCSRPCSRTCIRPCTSRPCVRPRPTRKKSSRIIPCPLPKCFKICCTRPSSCKMCSPCSPCFGMTVTEQNAVNYEPSPVEIIPRAPCIMSKPLMARPCPHCPPCLPPSGCYPYLMPCHWPARAGAPCTEPGRCFHTPPCPAPRVYFDPTKSDGNYKSPCPKSCKEYAQRSNTSQKCPIVICPGNNPELTDALRKVYGAQTEKKKKKSK